MFVMYNHHHYLLTEHSHHPERNTERAKHLHLSLPSSSPWKPLITLLYGPVLHTSYKWNHAKCAFVCLTSLSIMFSGSYINMLHHQYLIFLWLSNIPLYKYFTFCFICSPVVDIYHFHHLPIVNSTEHSRTFLFVWTHISITRVHT